jgi:hypothetical protein
MASKRLFQKGSALFTHLHASKLVDKGMGLEIGSDSSESPSVPALWVATFCSLATIVAMQFSFGCCHSNSCYQSYMGLRLKLFSVPFGLSRFYLVERVSWPAFARMKVDLLVAYGLS